jgi:hypothetical protein
VKRLRSSLVLSFAALVACAKNVSVGHEEPLAAAGHSSEPSGGASDGGLNGIGADAGDPGTTRGGSGGSSAGTTGAAGAHDENLVWRAGHEAVDFEEWLADEAGIKFLERSGSLALTTERAHGGAAAFVATIAADDGEVHQAVMGRDVTLRDGRYGAWYFVPESPTTGGWVLMKLSNGADRDRFDINLHVGEDGAPRLRLWEHALGWISEPAALTFPIGRWVHLEALYRSTAEPDGFLVVLQDGSVVLDTGARATAQDDAVTFFCGSVARYLAPAPFRLLIDDASIHRE